MLRSIRYTILVFAFAVTNPLSAVSIYDVIALSEQGYADEDVVGLIRNTRSVFELMAEDIPRLKQLGVSETVIRAMLVASPDYIVEEIAPVAADDDHPGEGADNQHNATRSLATKRFTVQLVSETAAGDHQHAYVMLTGVPVLVVRDEGQFRTVGNRAEAIAGNLEQGSRAGKGRFEALHADGADVVVYKGADFTDVSVMTVNARDVHAYDVRSEGRVTSDLLAAYWAALLNDYWAITFLHESPSRLIDLHRGDAFVLLFDLVERAGSDEPADLGSAVEKLPRTIQGHLEGLAQSVPADFEEFSEHIGEAS